MSKRTIGQNLRELREKTGDHGKKLTQQELANIMGVDKNTVYKWETDKVQLNAEHIVRLADFYEISTDELLRGGKAESLVMMNETGLSDQTINRLRQSKEWYETGKANDIWDVSKYAKKINLLFDEKIIEEDCEGQDFTTTDGEILLASLYDFICCEDLPVFDCTDDTGDYLGTQAVLYQIRVINDLQQLRKDYQRTREKKKVTTFEGRDMIFVTREHLHTDRKNDE